MQLLSRNPDMLTNLHNAGKSTVQCGVVRNYCAVVQYHPMCLPAHRRHPLPGAWPCWPGTRSCPIHSGLCFLPGTIVKRHLATQESAPKRAKRRYLSLTESHCFRYGILPCA